MNFTVENQNGNTYLVYRPDTEEHVDTTTLGMIINNRISGLAPAIYTEVDAVPTIKYNVSSKMQASRLMSGQVNRNVLIGLFRSICAAVAAVDDYMISLNKILFDLEYIYVDVRDYHAEMICVPLQESEEKPVNLKEFFQRILFSAVFDQQSDNSYVTVLMNYLNGSGSFSVEGFLEILQNIENGPIAPVQPMQRNPYQPEPMQNGSMNQPMNQQMNQPMNQSMNQYTAGGYEQSYQSQATQRTGFYAQGNRMQERRENPNPPNQQVNQFAAVPTPPKKEPLKENRYPISGGDQKVDGLVMPGNGAMMQPEQKKSDQASETNPQDNISVFHLLRHFDSETLAAYKKQKADKKRQKENKKAQNGQQQMQMPQQPQRPVTPPQVNGYQQMPQQPQRPVTSPQVNGYQQMPQQPQRPATPPQVNGYQQMPQQPQRPATPPQVNGYQQMPQQPQQPVAPDYRQMWPEPQNSSYTHSVDRIMGDSDGGTSLLDEGTTLLVDDTSNLCGDGNSEPKKVMPYIVRVATDERVPVTKAEFRIGRSKQESDYCIPDNKKIGRHHSVIISRGDKFFVVDRESLNHTYVNNDMIPSNVEVEIHSGDKIKLANEQLEFWVH